MTIRLETIDRPDPRVEDTLVELSPVEAEPPAPIITSAVDPAAGPSPPVADSAPLRRTDTARVVEALRKQEELHRVADELPINDSILDTSMYLDILASSASGPVLPFQESAVELFGGRIALELKPLHAGEAGLHALFMPMRECMISVP